MVSEQFSHLQLFTIKLTSALDTETKITQIYSGLTSCIMPAGNDKLEWNYSRCGVIFKQKYRGRLVFLFFFFESLVQRVCRHIIWGCNAITRNNLKWVTSLDCDSLKNK